MVPSRRLAGLAVLLTATILCLFIADRVPAEEGGLIPAGVLLAALGAVLLRRRTLPRSDRSEIRPARGLTGPRFDRTA